MYSWAAADAGRAWSPGVPGWLVITVVALWGLQVPLAVLLSRVATPATHGIWWAIAIAITVQGLLAAAWFERGRWVRQRV